MIRQMLVCPTCDGSGAGSAPIKGFTCNAGQCSDCRMSGEVSVSR
uniref:DnaJ-like chaperonin n=1 Tax=Mycobacterium phage LilBib TaxID=3136622 RepID=A0AAU8GPY3_9VIRU